MVVLIQLLINKKEVLKSALSRYVPQISVISLLYPPNSSAAVALWDSEPIHTKSWFLSVSIPNSWTKDGPGNTACLPSTSQQDWWRVSVRVRRPLGPPSNLHRVRGSLSTSASARWPAETAASDSARTAWLVATYSLRQLFAEHRRLWEESTQNPTQPEVSPGTQTHTWHPGYQCRPLNSSCLPAFSVWNPCWMALCDVNQLPHPHSGCVGSTGQCLYVYPPTQATWAQGWALPAHVNSRPIIYHLVCKVLWKRKDLV